MPSLREKKTWFLSDKAEIINKTSLQNIYLSNCIGDCGVSVSRVMIINQYVVLVLCVKVIDKPFSICTEYNTIIEGTTFPEFKRKFI